MGQGSAELDDSLDERRGLREECLQLHCNAWLPLRIADLPGGWNAFQYCAGSDSHSGLAGLMETAARFRRSSEELC